MKCSNNACMKEYDLKCIKVKQDVFKSFTLEYKNKWVCPECICLNPKRGNMDTPVRPDISRMHNTVATTPDNVNTQRGSQAQYSPTIITADDSVLLGELRQFREDILSRLDYQANAILVMQDQFTQTKNDLDKLVKIMTVLEQKINLELVRNAQNVQTQAHSMAAKLTKEVPTTTQSSFAEVVGQNKPNKPKPKQQVTSLPTTSMHSVNKRGAMKPTGVESQTTTDNNLSFSDNVEQLNQEVEIGWTTVQNKKPNRLPKKVTIGKNTEISGIMAMERKKYLHVWRLHPETTVETLSNYIKNLCGPEVSMKIEKIKHRTPRDYSSFVIGVPEKYYNMLNNEEVWPLNTEFNEWTWFRRQTATLDK
ncbi:hypothetical protein HF086_002787 [Spodoptera exigua]|uniref:Uncharacterized protein n=1 Tax=Spodoptera exigua TaxID=7107 RepID=A0A922SIW5_SPOEX|nr:hypothetical protein HF086_002787 [Spodoptera exigua]